MDDLEAALVAGAGGQADEDDEVEDDFTSPRGIYIYTSMSFSF